MVVGDVVVVVVVEEEDASKRRSISVRVLYLDFGFGYSSTFDVIPSSRLRTTNGIYWISLYSYYIYNIYLFYIYTICLYYSKNGVLLPMITATLHAKKKKK